jgi:hypothetical protein
MGADHARTCSVSPLLEEMSGDNNRNVNIMIDTELDILFRKFAHSVCENFLTPR